jgi:hypothetical protein
LRFSVGLSGVVLSVMCGAVTACATGGGTADDTTLDGSSLDATSSDGGGGGDSGNCPTGHTGPNCQNCAGGFHACGTSCEQDHPNQPDAGCSEGCGGTACSMPQNSTAKCTSDGHCDFACNTSYDKTDGGCVCPGGQIDCNGTCQECCIDSDCVGHQTCTGGMCSGCQQNWGDCNGNATDGCEADLSKEPNCGTCGTSCCGWGVSCCFTDLHGKSCKASGSSYSCQC